MENSKQKVQQQADYERLKASLVSLISHELRTPLTYVSASVEMIDIYLDTPDSKDEIKRFLGIIDQGVKQLNTIIDELLAFSNLENENQTVTPKIQEGVDLKELVCEMVNIVKGSTQSKKQIMEVSIQEDLPPITTDQGKLSEVLLQLLSNAIKFTPEEGHIRVLVKASDLNIDIFVSDNGPGISKEVQEQIFNPFVQVEDYMVREHGGLGLGLTLVQRYCRLIGARLSLESEPNEPGAIFKVSLPVINPSYQNDQEIQDIMDKMHTLSLAQEQKEAEISSMKTQLMNYTKALQKAYKSNDKQQLEIENIYIDMMDGFAAALEARDPYTKGRGQRIASYAGLLAEEIGLSDRERSYLNKACLLCDLGYIGISDDILHKDNLQALTEDELTHIRSHPVIGAQMLKHIKAFKPVVPIILSHHENWDGSGYPYQLKGKKIPFLARIVHLIDAFDAMLSDRSYRPRFSPEYALQEINKHSGTQFDPELVKLFIKLWESGRLQNLISKLEQEEKGNQR